MQDINTHFDFTVINGRVAVATDQNTLINYLDAEGRVLALPTLRNRVKYYLHQKTAPVRHYAGLSRLLRDYRMH